MSRAAREGATREELVREALHTLKKSGHADRIGVWIEPDPAEIGERHVPVSFCGAVWDRKNGATPSKWARLSPETSLPPELLTDRKSVELELNGSPDHPRFGPLVEMRRVLWVPVKGKGELQGVLLAGSRCEYASLRREAMESVASKLARAMEFAKEQRIARQWHADGPAEAQHAGLRQKRTDAELHSLIEWLEEGVVLFDAQEKVRAMNTRFAEIAGLTAEEAEKSTTLERLIGCLAGRAAEPQGFAERWRELARNLEGGIREELQMARPAPRVLERIARPVLDAAGRRAGRVEIYRDFTAQQLFQSKLLQVEKLAALGQMVTRIAHELSNPLASILGYAQRLLLREDAAGKSEEARHIFQEAERASKILRQLLVTSRERRPERRAVALNQMVLRTVDLQRFALAVEKIRIETDLDPLLPFVLGDAGQLQQVLMNLIGNAGQALKEQGRGGTIWLRTKRIGEDRVQLEVRDDGPGIPEAIQARIFDPFFTTKPAGVGTGLGLAIVLSIVREHGGQIRVASPPGGGTVFTMELPAEGVGGSARRRERTSEAQNKGVNEPQNLSSTVAPVTACTEEAAGRILVVEDEPTVAGLLADVLADEGFQVDVLLDGREALERAARENYDLVICDMKMPGLDGQHFYRTLVRTGNPLQYRFLFVTGDVISPHTQEFMERNQLPWVAKPFRVEELTEKVRQVLGAKDAREGPPAKMEKRNVARNG